MRHLKDINSRHYNLDDYHLEKGSNLSKVLIHFHPVIANDLVLTASIAWREAIHAFIQINILWIATGIRPRNDSEKVILALSLRA